MDLSEYVDALRGSLLTAAAAGGEQARQTAGLLADTMEPAVRLAVIDALSAMAAEVTSALNGDLVDVRWRGGEPEVVVTPAPHEPAEQVPASDEDDEDDGAVARISLRLPDALKARAERAAAAEALSLNAWLVRAVAAGLREPRTPPPSGRGPRHYTGFARS